MTLKTDQMAQTVNEVKEMMAQRQIPEQMAQMADEV